MRLIVFLLLGFACASSGHKAPRMADKMEQSELQTFAMLLKAFEPTLGWQGADALLGQRPASIGWQGADALLGQRPASIGKRAPTHQTLQAPSASHSRKSAPMMEYVLNDVKIANPVQPVGNYVLVKLSGDLKPKSTGGILLSEKEGKENLPLTGEVVAVGPGKFLEETGELAPCPCAVGDIIILPEAGGETFEYEGVPHLLCDADGVPGVFEGGDISVSSIRVLRDRIMFKLPEAEKETASGVLLGGDISVDADAGEVVAVGSGTMSSSGEMMVPEVKVGEMVVCQPNAGLELDLQGKTLRFVFEQQLLARWTE